MIKFSFVTISIFLMIPGLQGQDVRIYKEKLEQGYVIYGDNEEFYPTSVKFNFTLTNMVFSEDEGKIFVVPSKTKKFKIGELKMKVENEGSKFSYKYEYTMGDVMATRINESFIYDLPFQRGKSFKIYQGYNGSLSHQNENALDFTMPEGTEILAARNGTVVKVVESNTESCPSKECQKYNNYVTIMHEDGSYASYVHIKFNGAKVNVGDTVKPGDLIAYSGNVGWSTGPHLHLVIFLPRFGERKTLTTKFRINNGDQTADLLEGVLYSRGY